MAKKRSEELKRENARIHRNTTKYFQEKDLRKKQAMKFREVNQNVVS